METRKWLTMSKKMGLLVSAIQDGFEKDNLVATTVSRLLGMYIHGNIEDGVNNCDEHPLGKLENFEPNGTEELIRYLVYELLIFMESKIVEKSYGRKSGGVSTRFWAPNGPQRPPRRPNRPNDRKMAENGQKLHFSGVTGGGQIDP